jgi:hypothetical protein
MKLIYQLMGVSLFMAIALPLQAQAINPGKFIHDYKESCTKQQAQLHIKVKGVSADSFGEYCDCTTRQLMSSLSADQMKELNQGGARPNWLKATEQSASKACIREGPGIRV